MTINKSEEIKVIDKWQKLLNLTAKIHNVPAALIMKVHLTEIEVFLSSNSKNNPYEEGELAPLCNNLYCEKVMATRDKLLVKNALDDPDWMNNPDTELNMNFYLGVPLIWPNGEIFGTLCVLDSKENVLAIEHTGLLLKYKHTIEKDLADIYWREIVTQYKRKDNVTGRKKTIRLYYLKFIILTFLYRFLSRLVYR